mmetsp:Transcript_29406/g.61789  ORF Transcript_29406/g.61789 Transcript_29406/m.61789 type:complete len:267 (-) Transcript_29406:401-1201(-)
MRMAGPVLDQEAVAGICRRARRLGGAEHAVQLLQQQACDPLGRERRDARRARPRNETDHREGWQRLWPHRLRRRREPHLRKEAVGAHSVVEIGWPEARAQAEQDLERVAHADGADCVLLPRRQLRRELDVATLKHCQRHANDDTPCEYDTAVRTHHTHTRAPSGNCFGWQQLHTCNRPTCPDIVQRGCKRFHGILQTRSLQHQVFFAIAPGPLFGNNFVQANLAHVSTVVVGKNSISKIQHSRRQSLGSEVLEKRLLWMLLGIRLR